MYEADAPGRVNLLGEHTDYHGGFVLPTVLPQRTTVRLTPRGDDVVRVRSGTVGAAAEYRLGRERRGGEWLDYVQGVTAALATRGVRVSGFDAAIESTVPVGAGVSSSAALTVALLRALRQANSLALDDVALARVAQAAETEFVGAPIGIMDQMACSVGRAGEALFLDTRTLAFERIPLPANADVLAIHSGHTHAHAGGEYATRRRESFEAAALLGVDQLRDLGVDALPRIAALRPVLARRARHIVTENQRVLDGVAALRAGDAAALGVIFNASHASMRDDYEVSIADVDALVSCGQTDPDVYGARLTGGGFGGAVVMLARRGRGSTAAARVLTAYQARTGRRGTILLS
jgi:galactokinase